MTLLLNRLLVVQLQHDDDLENVKKTLRDTTEKLNEKDEELKEVQRRFNKEDKELNSKKRNLKVKNKNQSVNTLNSVDKKLVETEKTPRKELNRMQKAIALLFTVFIVFCFYSFIYN